MFNEKKLVYIKALTSVHAGTGQGLETVDMPIQRERHSNIPKIEASSLKGSIKHWIYQNLKNDENLKELLNEMLGPENGETSASRLGFTDARLLFFPIKSDDDIYKLVTCPYILNRWKEDLKFADDKMDNKQDEPDKKDKSSKQDELNKLREPEYGKCFSLKKGKIFLEEYIFESEENDCINNLANIINRNNDNVIDKNKIVILNNTEFIDLVTMYTEIVTRNRIDFNTGTTIEGGLFSEEYLPSESIMYFTLLASPNFSKNDSTNPINFFDENIGDVFQVGGDATIGKGFVKKFGGYSNGEGK